jgi:rhodanese-related sulfurtransferase
MGPLVPEFISENMSYIVGFFIGLAFGAILEQAGFSSSRKLVGLFYGYDFTVLRVFFTAGVVAMVGILGLSHFGLLDITQIYVNPTFLWSAIVGGLIMGLGFVVGGFCPGTSVSAAAIGKIDAWIFIGGIFVGVFIFAEGYPLFEELYKAAYMGNIRVSDTFDISANAFAFIMVLVAFGAFYALYLFEQRKQKGISFFKFDAGSVAVSALFVVLAVGALWFTDRRERILRLSEDKEFVARYPVDVMDLDEALFWIMERANDKVQFIDFRKKDEFLKMALPNSYNFTVENLFEKGGNSRLKLKGMQNVFVADDEFTERQMAVIAKELGYKRVFVLRGGLDAFRREILGFEEPKEAPKTLAEEWLVRFRTKAKQEVLELIKENKPKEAPKQKEKRKLGGC